jgi:hypothetical protein
MSGMGDQTAQLRLLAEDAEDLEIIAAALQDAVGKIGDIRYEAPARQVTLVLNRFCWESDDHASQRVRAGLQFGGVLSAQARKLRRDAPDAVIELLTIEFEPGEAPGGVILLSFAGGGDLRLEVECVDAALADVSEPWPVKHKPSHEA